jgi:hypothetical protein
VYPPVDLNAPELLATDGLAPSESDPRFHQQMCYAVAMKTIEHFERALGRKALWSSHRWRKSKADGTPGDYQENFVPRLRIYPHALRQNNAYYSPDKKALLLGYFRSKAASGRGVPGATVFTCLSHDIIAHETTHALLDGVHPRFNEPVNADVLAFHEAFADIVALFQHFSYPGVLRDQIARTRGDLARESLLGQLAQQFAQASGRDDALRSYLGAKDENGVWQPKQPNPDEITEVTEPHARGAILVAAVFGAFSKVYRGRTRDLFRIATDGTGVLPDGDIHPDLVNRLAEEAQRAADRGLQMCIRAIDYCPPVGITFGAYLRALVTADVHINPADPENWRLAFIESFREWGITPGNGTPMAEDSLLWPRGDMVMNDDGQAKVRAIFEQEAPGSVDVAYKARWGRARKAAAPKADVLSPASLVMSRYDTWLDADRQSATFHQWLMAENWEFLAKEWGLVIDISSLPKSISSRAGSNRANVEVHSVRTAMKRGALGWPEPYMVVVVTQYRAGYFDVEQQKRIDARGPTKEDRPDFRYRAGCTLLFDPEGMSIRRVIRTPGNVADQGEFNRMQRYLLNGLTPPNAFAFSSALLGAKEPFALLHSGVGS